MSDIPGQNAGNTWGIFKVISNQLKSLCSS